MQLKPLPLGVLEAPGETHMKIDTVLLDMSPKEPLVRIGIWPHPAVSLGYRQTTRNYPILEKIRKLGLEAVVRPTGGLTILHHQGTLTIHLVGPRIIVEKSGGVEEAGILLARWIARALRKLGYNVETWKSPPGRKKLVPRDTSICMAYTGSADLLVDKAKVGAGALRITSRGVLFQAYIIGGEPDYHLWAKVDDYPEPSELSKAFIGLGDPPSPSDLLIELIHTGIEV